ncbi:MAG: tRNA (adenosine(37)-N6)-threonylcarbamoyltransferase complex dimerization subunit type 1 TsaB [Anaerolinea sp.]|nr:tRNA (adenosine(37)-N6)-threonylcarbamoyltransferase complex dimerization subunit type 1 TsaB [Anaerolinea sp.]
MLLALDTATSTMSLALHDGARLLAEETWVTANNHSSELAPGIQRLLERVHVAPDHLTALAVSIGPGTYSGLRTGVALAKGMAAACNLPLVGVSTLDTLAAASAQFQGGLIVIVQAGRGRVIAGAYRWAKGRWRARGEAQNFTWDALMQSIDGPCLITGEVDDNGRAAIAAARSAGKLVTLASGAARLRRAGYLAEEAWARLSEAPGGQYFAPAEVVPVYVKTKDTP